MKSASVFIAAIALGAVCSVSADYLVMDQGTWPKTWPAELEPLRKQARSLEGPLGPQMHYQIPFTKREDFEAAWPHLLKVPSKGAPITLVRSPYTRLGKIDAGVFIHTPSDPTGNTCIDLIVDGTIVDLNRIPLPADTPIIDERFKDGKNK